MTHRQDGTGKESSSRPMEMPAVKTTIVGGRPPGCGKMLGAIPRGIEVLVKKACVDPAFRALLLARRSGAADEIGLKLAPAEGVMLDHVPQAQLEAIINRTRVDPSRRNAFLSKAAGVMLAALGASAVVSDADAGPTKGVRPDANAPVATQPASKPTTEPVSRGVRPDMPPREVAGITLGLAAAQPATGPSTQPLPPPAGIRPDVPPPVTGSRPDPPPTPAPPAPIPPTGAVEPAPAPPAPVGLRMRVAGVVVGPVEPAPAQTQPANEPAPVVVWGMRPASKPASAPTTSQPAATQGSQPATQPALSAKEIDALVKQLDDDKFTVREAAHKKLQDQGLAILPALREVLRNDKLGVEARTRLESIVSTLAATTQPVVRPDEIRVVRGLRVAP